VNGVRGAGVPRTPNGAIANGQGVGTIVDDEPRISISDVTKREGRKGTTLFKRKKGSRKQENRKGSGSFSDEKRNLSPLISFPLISLTPLIAFALTLSTLSLAAPRQAECFSSEPLSHPPVTMAQTPNAGRRGAVHE
jgi:hypothetical protein